MFVKAEKVKITIDKVVDVWQYIVERLKNGHNILCRAPIQYYIGKMGRKT